MFLTDFVLKKPISTLMLYIIIVILSVLSLTKIPISLVPNLDYPKLSVIAYWPDASPEEVESHITSPIESFGSMINGVSKISSSSYPQQSVVNFEFERNTDLEYAKFELNEKLQLLQDKLPTNVHPHIQEYVPQEFSETDFLTYGISGKYQTEELNDFIEKYLKFQILSVEGVADCTVDGKREKEIIINLKNNRQDLVSIGNILNLIRNFDSKNAISGFKQNGKSIIIKVKSKFKKIDELNDLNLRLNNGNLCKLGEIASIKEQYQPAYQLLRSNGNPLLLLKIEKKNNANSLKLAKKIKKIIASQKNILPKELKITKIDDESEKINSDLQVLYQRGIFALLIIFIVLILFLRHIQSAFVVLLSILFSTSLTFIFLYLTGVGLNMLSLAGITLGLGMIVDNSIVIYENIFRHQTKFEKGIESIKRSVREISLPIISSTLTTIIVFVPFLYMQGDLKIFYLPFVYATVFSLLSSLFVSFTFIPLISYRYLNFTIPQPTEKIPNKSYFEKIQLFFLRFRWIWLSIIMIFLGYSIWLFVNKVDKGFSWVFPKDDYLKIYISLPVGSNIDQADYIAKKFEKKTVPNKQIKSVRTTIRSTFAYLKLEFDEKTKKTSIPLLIREELKAYAVNFGNSDISIQGFGPSFGGGGISISNFSLELLGYNYQKLKEITHQLSGYMKKISRRVTDIEENATSWWKKEKLFQYEIVFDRKKLAENHFEIYTVMSEIYSVINNSQNQIQVHINEEEMPMLIMNKAKDEKTTVNELLNLVIINGENKSIKLKDVAKISKKEILPEINKKNEQFTRRINFDFRGSKRKGDKFIKFVKNNFPLPIGYRFAKDENYFGNDKSNNKQLLYLIIAAIILVYMSLCALYESFKYPLIIIFAIPLAFTGVSWIFYFTGDTFDSNARLGIILLSGIVVNNAIILIDHINHLVKQLPDLKTAIVQAIKDRVRPILMTTLTTTLGLLPMLLQSNSSQNKFWYLLSLSTIGGLITSTFFVIFFIPTIYYIMTRKSRINF
jgi:HAE1 family hydrophobic/amphiphilic exporter-1